MRTFSRSITKSLVVVAAALLITAPFHSVAYGQTTTWTDSNGDWNTPGNWSAGVPNSTTSAVINNGSSVSLSAVGSTNNLTLASGNSLTISNNTSLTVFGSSISDSGTINLSSVGNGTDLIISNANTTLSGTGTLTLSNNSQNFIFGSVGADKLTNQSTIQGSGNIGNGQMTMANSGTINANSGSGSNALFIQTSGGTTNTGTLEATNGSVLQITGASGGNVTNTGGTIKAVGSGSVVQLTGGVVITGGTLTTTTGGAIQGIGTATLSGLTISSGSSYQVNNNTTTFLGGTITNNGTLTLASSGNGTNLELSGNVTLTGSGTVSLSNNTQNFIFGVAGSNVLTNQETIQGAGNIGSGQMSLVNSGTINANAGLGQNSLTIQVGGFGSTGTTNTGILEATGGSNLVLVGQTFTNTGGTIEALNNTAGGSTVTINNADIIGGTLTTTGNGVIFGINGTVLDGTSTHAVTNSGLFEIPNGSSTSILGTINNTGTILLNSAGNGTDLIVGNNTGATSATINGTVTMSNNSQNFIFGALGTNTLTNNGTIQGAGNIGNGQMTLANSGTINANAGNGQNSLIIQTSGGTTNTGTLESTSSGLVLTGASGGNITNTGGTIQAVGNGAAVNLQGGITITGGTLTSTGTGLIQDVGTATLNSVTVSTGSDLALQNNDTLTLGISLTNNGTINMNAAGNFTDLLISGNVSLNGKAGVLVMSNSPNNLILGTTSAAILTNNSTIEGAGNIGDADMGLVNGKTGVISANSGLGQNALFIQPDTNNFTNNGTLSAVNGSVLDIITTNGAFTNFSSTTNTLTGGTYIANGGTIEFNAGSSGIVTNAANITLEAGGSIFNTNTSTSALTNFATNNSGASFTLGGTTSGTSQNFTTIGNFTNNGTLTVNTGSMFTVNLANSLTNFNSSTHTLTRGTYIDSGTLQFAGANIQTIAANTGVTMSGASAKIEDQTGAAVGLTNLATNNGTFAIASGFNFTTAGNFTNNGTLNVGSGTTFIVNLADSLTNFNSGTSTLTSGTYIVGGTLKFANASIVTNDASITLSGTNSKIVNQSNVDALATTFATNDTGATFALASGRNFTTPGNFTNNGTLTVGSSNSKFDVNGSLTNFSGTTLNSGTYNVTGTLQFNGANIVTNAANITLTGTSSQIIDQLSANGLANFATNNGTFALAGSRSFTTAGNFANAGTFTINTGSTFSLGGSGMFTQSGGTTTDNGSLSAPGAVNLQGGSLFGTGSITGALTSSSAGTIDPGTSSTATGILKDTGSYSQNSGTLDISINGTTPGTKYDQFNPTTASLSGTLNISRPTGFVPAIGSTFKILNFTSETGTFSTVNGLAINSSEHFTITYQPTNVLLTVVPGPADPTPSPTTVTSSTNVTSSRKIVDSDLKTTGKKATGTVINVSSTDQLLSLLDGAAPGPGGKITIPASKTTSHWRNSSRMNAAGRLNADREATSLPRRLL